MQMKYTSVITFCLLLALSCREATTEEHHLSDSIEQAWQEAETSLPKALASAAMVRDSVGNAPEYVRKRYDLLIIRLRDKQDMPASSPDSALHVASYFEGCEDVIWGERAYYYLGSAYRDLKDYPRAVSCFLKAVDAAVQSPADADTLIWQNALSQLGHLYMLQLNYEEELAVKLQAVSLARQSGRNLGFYLAETAAAYKHLNDTLRCLRCTDEAYRIIREEKFPPKYGRVLGYMLVTYSGYKRYEKLDTLLGCLLHLPEGRRPYNYELCLAKFHEHSGRTDSAIFHYKACYDREQALPGRYEASAGLQRCYMQKEDYRRAAEWGCRLYDINDSIIARREFEETQRARDTYTYYRDREKEQAIMLRDETLARRDQAIMFVSVIIGLALVSTIMAGLAFYYFRRKRFMEEIVGRDRLLESAREEIDEHLKELKQNEKINKDLTQIALFGNATEGAEDVIRHFLLASSGKVSLGKDSWKMLMSAVETLYPGFLEAIMDRQQGHLHEPLLRTICLLKIGMKPSQIARVMDAKKQTVWSRVKRAEEMCGSLLRAD